MTRRNAPRRARSAVRTAAALVFCVLAGAAGCAVQNQPEEPAPEPPARVAVVNPAADAGEPERGPVPYEGPLPPPNPLLRVMPGQQPVEPWVAAALDVWYQRPSPEGPPPIPRPTPKAIYVVGKDPVIQVLPGPFVFAEHLPEILRTAMPEKGPFSNNVVKLPKGDFRVVAFDYTHNDTKLSRDSMAVEIAFTDDKGARWKIEQAAIAPISPNPVMEPWFGGLIIDTLYHGETGNGTPAEPLVNCAMCSWGWADVWKNDKKVASSVPLHVMVTSDVRDDRKGFEYACYDCRDRPIREVHIIIPPSSKLPTPGGFLHVMWENAEIKRGTPQQIAAAAPKLEKNYPTIVLKAVPYLQWGDTAIHVVAGQRYRLIVQNEDPSSAHAMHLHMTTGGHHHGSKGESQQGPHAPESHAMANVADGLPPEEHEIKVPIPQGSMWATTVEFPKPGEYHFYCPVWNHHDRGMTGKFIASAPTSGGGQ